MILPNLPSKLIANYLGDEVHEIFSFLPNHFDRYFLFGGGVQQS